MAKNKQQLNITCGTDVVLHARLMFDGETFDPSLSVGIVANLVTSMGKRNPLDVEVDGDELVISIPWVEGRNPGCYGLEVTGTCNSKKWSTYADSLIRYTKATRHGAGEVTVESDYYDITMEVGYRYGEGGNVNDVLVNGESVVQAGKARITMPTKVSDLENDADYATQEDVEESKISEVEATVDDNVGTPEVDVTLAGHKLTLAFQNIMGDGIASIEQTTTSEESEGVNVVTVTTVGGKVGTFQIRNGAKGDTVILGEGVEYTLYNGIGDNTDGAMTQHAVKVALETKVDKVQGKSLIDDEIVSSIHFANDTGYLEIKSDQEGKVLEGITLDGKKKVFLPTTIEGELEVQGNASYIMESNDYVAVTLDNHNKILLAIKDDGDVVFGCGVPSEIKQYVDENSSRTGTDIVSQNDVVYTEKALKNLKRPSRSANTVQYTPFVLLHASDIHGDGETLERMVEYYNHYKTYIDDALISGDMVSGVYDDDIAYYRNTDGAEKIMLAVGNHDTAKEDGSTTIWDYYVGQASYERFIKDFYSEWGNVSIVTNKCYYHKDYADYGIRMIVTDCMDVSTDAQLTWLEGVLESTPSGYSVLCVCHYPYYPKVTDVANASPHIECSFDSRQNAPTVADAHIPVSFIDAVDEWMANHRGKFICWLSGHTHADYVCIAKGTTQLVITIDTAAHTSRNIGYSDTERVSGKKSMDLFNLVGIDTYQKLIKVMRVGADMDSWMRRKETMCIQYASNNVYTLEDDMPKLIYCS